MSDVADRWGFFGRGEELGALRRLVDRRRWFFLQINGRRRIGKTTLVQQALGLPGRPGDPRRDVLRVEIPDSGEAGVLSAVADAMETFRVPPDRFPAPRTMAEFAGSVEALARAGYLVVLDEFQYFARPPYAGFCSHLQYAVDRLSADAGAVPGGLIVLGSLHTEMVALLEDRAAPLYGRRTDAITLTHLDVASLLELLRAFGTPTPDRLLFFYTLFEGVPKYYRDAHERGVLRADAADRRAVLDALFFRGSSPLRTEATDWFLRELRGRNDMVLKFVARRPGLPQGELKAAIRERSGERLDKISVYLTALTDKYRLVERRQPVFAKPGARRGRYYLTDNFLQAWLAALAGPVAARQFRPVDGLLGEADDRLRTLEGVAFEKLAGSLYEERSRKGLPGFPLTRRVEGFWDKAGVEIDLVAVNEPDRVIRFGSCKRSAKKLAADLPNFAGHVERFLAAQKRFAGWTVERAGLAPAIGPEHREVLERHGVIPQDLRDLTAGLVPGQQACLF